MKTGHRLRFQHQILEHFVQRRSHVDIAIRERRPVVKDEFRRAVRFPFVHNLLVNVLRLPLFKPGRLIFNKISPHRKIR